VQGEALRNGGKTAASVVETMRKIVV